MSNLFEAVVFRYVPDEGAAESLNVGLAMRTEGGNFFRVRLADSWKRITDAFPTAHGPTIRSTFAHVRDALDRLESEALVMPGMTTLADELRRLVPSPDGYLKWSETIEGVTNDPDETFKRLMFRYVEQHLQKKPERISRSDDDVKAAFEVAIEKRVRLRTRLTPKKLVAKDLKHFEMQVDHSWKNGRWNCVQPISLDMVNAHDITQKAAQIAGSVQIVVPSEQDAFMVLLVGLPPTLRSDAFEAAQEAIAGVRRLVQNEAEVVLEADCESLLDRIEADLATPH